MRILYVLGLSVLLSGCLTPLETALVAGGGVWAGSLITTDKSPLEHASAFLGKRCENYSYFDLPRRCIR